jgi:hypothetical protein
MLDILLPAIATLLVALALSPLRRHRAGRPAICAGLLLLAAFAAGYSSAHLSPGRLAVVGVCALTAAILAAGMMRKR